MAHHVEHRVAKLKQLNQLIKSPVILSIKDTVNAARPAHDLPFASLTPDELSDVADRVYEAIKEYKKTQGLNVDDIPWVGLPNTFWYWTESFTHYNKRQIIMPCAISEPEDAEKIRVIVNIAKMAKVHVQARAGGHSYGGYSWGGKDGSFVIDLKHLNKISVDKLAMTATIEPGALLGDVTKVMAKAGVMTPHGICPQVGVGGHCTIGGQGPSSRMYGMMLDQIIAFDIILADGRYLKNVTKDDPEHADLFWAVRGAGASFGIVTQIVVKVYPDLEDITHWTYEVTNGTPEQLSNAYDEFQKWAMNPNLSRRFASTCIMTNGRLAIERTFFGNEDDPEIVKDNFHDDIDVTGVKVKQSSSKFTKHAAAGIQWLEDRALTLGGGIPAKFYVKSLVLNADQPIPSDVSTKLFNYMANNAPRLALWFILSDLQGGRTNDKDLAEASCYGHREGILIFQFYAIDANLIEPTFSPEITAFIEGLYNIVLDGVQGLQVRVYPGYVDPALGPECEEIYWGDNAPRLRQIKTKYDPENMFANPQSVRPAAAE